MLTRSVIMLAGSMDAALGETLALHPPPPSFVSDPQVLGTQTTKR